MSLQLDPRLEEWTADEVAECLDYISSELSARLWSLKSSAKRKTPLGGDGTNGTVETPDGRLGDFDDKMPAIWGKLTEQEQKEINKAANIEWGSAGGTVWENWRYGN